MYSSKTYPFIRPALFILMIAGAFFFDVIFGISRYPVMVMVVCGIVVLYEIVSPFIYSSR